MAKINGTDLLVYADGTLIAYQKTCTVNWEQDLPDATTKDSGGWEEHLNGTRRATCDFDGLYSTTGLSAEDLITYITGRTSCTLLIDGGGYPIIGEARPKNLSVNAPQEEASAISGSFAFDGPAWMLIGDYAQLNTSWTNVSFETLTSTGTLISSGIDSSSGYIRSNALDIEDASVYKIVLFVTKTSGTLPTADLVSSIISVISTRVALTEGVNVITLTSTAAATAGYLRFIADNAVNFNTSKIYLFKA